MPNDTEFHDPRLVAIYDSLNPLGPDSGLFCRLVHELAAGSIIDLGCGTGILTCELAFRGHGVIGIEPSGLMLDVARKKPNAKDVEWIQGSYEMLAGRSADMVLMTSHVAQFFLEDKDWRAMIAAARTVLDGRGHHVFDVRRLTDPPFQGWPTDKQRTRVEDTPLGPVEWWFSLTAVDGRFVRYRLHYFLESSSKHIVSDNELVFRSYEDIVEDLSWAGFNVDAVYGDWDMEQLTDDSPEMIFIASCRCGRTGA